MSKYGYLSRLHQVNFWMDIWEGTHSKKMSMKKAGHTGTGIGSCGPGRTTHRNRDSFGGQPVILSIFADLAFEVFLIESVFSDYGFTLQLFCTETTILERFLDGDR
jgi:hypothetical protein